MICHDLERNKNEADSQQVRDKVIGSDFSLYFLWMQTARTTCLVLMIASLLRTSPDEACKSHEIALDAPAAPGKRNPLQRGTGPTLFFQHVERRFHGFVSLSESPIGRSSPDRDV